MNTPSDPARSWANSLARAGLALALVALSSACATVNPHFNPAKPHHRPDGFQNNYTSFQPRGLGEVLRWKLAAALEGLPPAPRAPTPQMSPNLGFIQANAKAGASMVPAVTWIGHASALLQIPTAAGGLNILTDPVFSERASPVAFVGPKRAQPPGLTLAQLPRIDLVLVSHNHYDHLDAASVDLLNAQAGGPPLFVVPLGIKAWLAERGITRAVELDWWGTHTHEGLEIVLTPAQHWSGRGVTDRLATLWGGFALFSPLFHAIYTGDTGYSKDFADIATRFAARQGAASGGSFDLALIPIGAYEPRWFMETQHVNPDESVRIHRDLRAKRSMGVHWGTFNLTDEALDEPPLALERARLAHAVADDAFFVLAVGQTRQLPRRQPAP
jgi:N-acyl-phosphatidylethanolamine-hydrolysing phospholipase D